MSRPAPQTAVQAVAQTEKNFMATLIKNKDQLAMALPKHITPDRMLRLINTVFRHTPKLLECEPQSVFLSIIEACQLGLEPGTPLGHGYLIPRKLKGQLTCTFMPGYKGLLDLARRSGQIISVEAHVVHANDTFHYEYGTNGHVTHVRAAGRDRGEKIACWAMVKLRGGGVQFDVMTADEIEDLKARIRIQNYLAPGAAIPGPWSHPQDEAEMWKKSVLKRVLKLCPASVEYQYAAEFDSTGVMPLAPPPSLDLSDLESMTRTAGSGLLAAVGEAAPAARVAPDTGEVFDQPEALSDGAEVTAEQVVAAAQYASLWDVKSKQVRIPDAIGQALGMNSGLYKADAIAADQAIAAAFYEMCRRQAMHSS